MLSSLYTYRENTLDGTAQPGTQTDQSLPQRTGQGHQCGLNRLEDLAGGNLIKTQRAAMDADVAAVLQMLYTRRAGDLTYEHGMPWAPRAELMPAARTQNTHRGNSKR